MKYYILVLVALVFFNCKKSNEPTYGKKATSVSEVHPGKKLMENNCYVCHSPTASQNDRIGPPMIAIKKHYISKNTTKEDFIASMQDWIKNPTKEKAKMYGAVKRFGLMPKQAFPEETIQQIAAYMFDHKIEQPDWFEDHYNQEKGKGMGKGKGKGMKIKEEKNEQKQINNQANKSNYTNLPYSQRGLKYALSTKAVLGKNLMGKIQTEGTLAALQFCNIKAYSLTDSMAVYHNATIKRVSDKPRNPKNKAAIDELGYISIFKDDAKNNKESQPIVVETSQKVNVYYPIKTNGMCLQCHGDPKTQITENTFSAIQKLYPNDKALGYDINQVRGIWNVSFTK